MNRKKIIALFLAAAALTGIVSGCGNSQKQEDGKINISIGLWPDNTNQKALDTANKQKDDFMLQNPDINILPDTYKYDTKTFTMKASANQLPNMFKPWFTEIKQIIKQGYAADITDAMKNHGFDTALNPQLIDLVTGDDGKIYGVPTDAYILGLYVNKDIFKQAGLVNSDDSVKFPDTWEQLAEYAQTIKEKTGKAGFILPTTNNCGGWQFLNIAWGFGVEFCKQRDDGSWEATFDTQEARDALQFVKDLKWKYNAFPDDTVINQDDMYKYFGSGQAAMMMREPPFSGYQWGLSNDALACTKMPKGKVGRFTQMGGNLWMFSKNSTPEQIDAGFKWLEFTGFAPTMNADQENQYRTSQQNILDKNGVVIERDAYDVWTIPETLEKRRSIRREYSNVDYNDYKTYFEADDVQVKLEPAACAQQLYSIMDGCIQEVITNKDADIDSLIKTACQDYQTNHLDKM